MDNCKDCIFYVKSNIETHTDKEDDMYEYDLLASQFGRCKKGTSNNGRPINLTTKAYALDSESYNAGLVMFQR